MKAFIWLHLDTILRVSWIMTLVVVFVWAAYRREAEIRDIKMRVAVLEGRVRELETVGLLYVLEEPSPGER